MKTEENCSSTIFSMFSYGSAKPYDRATLEATSIQGVVDPVFRRAIDKEKQRRLRCQDHKNRITQTYFSGIWSFKPFLGIHVKLPGSANKEPSSITDVAILWSAIRFHNLPLLWTSMLFYTCSLVFLLFLTTWLVVSLIIFKCWGHLLRLSKSRTGKSSCCRISQVYPSDKKTRGKKPHSHKTISPDWLVVRVATI